MKIRRSRLTADFVQIPNRTARDERLGYMARGILTDLLSRPDGWEATAKDLWLQARKARGESAESRRQFESAFAELKTEGYLVASREQRQGGRFTTVLTLHDVPAGRADTPHAGMSARPGETGVSAGRTDIPTAGTSAGATDIPACGTSEPPAETAVLAGHADIPAGGVSEPPGKTGVSAGRTDIPTVGMSKKKTGLENGKENSLSAPERQIVDAVGATAEEAREMIRIITTDNPKIKILPAYLSRMTENGTLETLLGRVRAGERSTTPSSTPVPPPVATVLAQTCGSEIPRSRNDEPPPDRDESIAAARQRLNGAKTKRGGGSARFIQPPASPKAEDPAVQAAYDRLSQCGDYDRWWTAARNQLGTDAHRDDVAILASQLVRTAVIPVQEAS
ncbi:hypothetical protein GCM10017673_57520 [Streptosporangium violaceochromogenes]|nr:hypothetical protein GCM10017673_57520 [Streptosporangium violaceochromogenes]